MMSMTCSMTLSVAYTLRPWARLVEFMREPFGGRWVGQPGWLRVSTIADGANMSESQTRRTLLRHPKKFQVLGSGRSMVARLGPESP